MARVIGAGTVTGRFSTAEYGSDDRAWAHVLEIGDGVEQFRSALFEGG
jgi:hypothetical protein